MFLRRFLTFAKSNPNVSYKDVSYKKHVYYSLKVRRTFDKKILSESTFFN